MDSKRAALILTPPKAPPIEPGADVTCEVESLSRHAFKPDSLFIEPPSDWTVLSLRIGITEQFAPEPIPIEVLASAPAFNMSIVHPGQIVTLKLRNASTERRPLRACLFGQESTQ